MGKFKLITFSDKIRFFTEYLTLHIPNKREIINIASKVDGVVKKSGIKDGIVLVNAMYITALVFINDEEERLKKYFPD